MPWFKVDDALYSHPKWVAASAPARALWVTAGSWSASQLTDGLVPRHVLAMLGGKPKDAAELVAVGLWDVDGNGWRFHDWLSFQPSAAQTLAARAAAKERQQKHRASRRDKAVTNGVSHTTPTRPDPTPVPNGTGSGDRPAFEPLSQAQVEENLAGAREARAMLRSVGAAGGSR